MGRRSRRRTVADLIRKFELENIESELHVPDRKFIFFRKLNILNALLYVTLD